jgi:hypothetical protein
MKSKILLIMVIGLFLVSSAAMADYVVGTGAATFQNYPVDLQQNGVPYWDGNSSDFGSPGTIGNYLTKTDAFAGSGLSLSLVTPQWWGNANGTADPNMYFQEKGGGPGTAAQTVLMKIEVAGQSGTNSFGYYKVGSEGTRTELFNGPAGVGASTNFTVNLGDQYGFYLQTSDNTIYYMDSTYSGNPTADKGNQHFAIFRDFSTYPGKFFIGCEDLPFSGSDLDYQDMIVMLSPAGGGSVPLPPSAILLGSGLLGLVALRWSRR